MIYAIELPELSMSGVVVTKSDIVLSPTFESNFTHNPWAANLCH